ncbi:hypothetical protein J2X26_001212 [Cellulomonas humilata]|uniref:Uncharacterized protein n=1 Tax=Cellulomonas humilata TaxID=144055 RepID=A0ABU0ECC5_9CELL|nr:hypothetical protein [Cellulomonas humilata]
MRDVLPGVCVSGLVVGSDGGVVAAPAVGPVAGPHRPDLAPAAGAAPDVTDGMSGRPLSRPTLVR